MSLHNAMVPHGSDGDAFAQASASPLVPRKPEPSLRRFTEGGQARLGVGIGASILDLRRARAAGLPLPETLADETLNAFMAVAPPPREARAHALVHVREPLALRAHGLRAAASCLDARYADCWRGLDDHD